MNENQALKGLKVADFTQGIAGPYSAMMLAQAGATVTKIEPPSGDWCRTLGVAYGEHCSHSIAVNLGKKSIALDLKSAEGLDLARRIALEADIVLESFRPGVMAKFGLDYKTVSASSPNVIYLSVTGFGQQGPYSDRPVTDGAIQGFSGWMSLTRDENGVPLRTGMVAMDFMTGLFAYQSLLKAIISRGISGEGTYIDCSLMQSAAAFQSAKILEYHMEKGKPIVLYVPAGTMKTADGFLNIAVMKEQHYTSLCNVIGRSDLQTDPRFNSRENRVANEADLMIELRQEFAKRTTADWSEVLHKAGVIHSKVNSYGDYLENEQVQAVNGYTWLEHAGVGEIPLPRIPGFPSFEPGSSLATSPGIGENSREILQRMGIDASDIDHLVTSGVVLAKD